MARTLADKILRPSTLFGFHSIKTQIIMAFRHINKIRIRRLSVLSSSEYLCEFEENIKRLGAEIGTRKNLR